jgi:uncharacterized membrane protein YfcA
MMGRIFGIGVAKWLSENLPEPWSTIILIAFIALAVVIIIYAIIEKRKSKKQKDRVG